MLKTTFSNKKTDSFDVSLDIIKEKYLNVDLIYKSSFSTICKKFVHRKLERTLKVTHPLIGVIGYLMPVQMLGSLDIWQLMGYKITVKVLLFL